MPANPVSCQRTPRMLKEVGVIMTQPPRSDAPPRTQNNRRTPSLAGPVITGVPKRASTATHGGILTFPIELWRDAGLIERVIYSLLLAIPLAVVADVLHAPPAILFAIAALGIVPLAKIIGEATEALAEHVGAGIGALLNATFGNAIELMIAVLALTQGLTEVVKASITGAILVNLLFGLGVGMVVGGLRREKQSFNKTGVSAATTQLALAAIALVVPAVFATTIGESRLSVAQRSDQLEYVSLGVAGILIVSYIAQLIFSLRTHPFLYSEEAGDPNDDLPDPSHPTLWTTRRSLVVLVAATAVAAFVSEILVGSIEGLTTEAGLTELFVGVILLAVVGGAAEIMTVVQVAVKDKMNLALNVAIGSTGQVALLLAPLLVFIGFFTGHRLSLSFELSEMIAITLAVLIVNFVAQDGESNWVEGVQLIAAYAIIGIAFYLHP